MCAPRWTKQTLVVLMLTVLTACAAPQRTGTNFCRQLASEMPEIGQPITTTREMTAMVARYERLLEVAPLSVEKDLAVLTDLLQRAERVNPNDADQLQALADASYAANQSALTVREWVKSTCAVDISTGLNIEPPRVATTTTTTIPATTTSTIASGATTEAPVTSVVDTTTP